MNKPLPTFKTLFMTLMMVMAGISSTLAQSREITGVVTDGNAALPGVSILEKGTSNGTVTDADGKFAITVDPNAILTISFIGMKPKEIVVGAQTSIQVAMENDVSELGEIVVIGYGEVERKDLASSVSSIQAKQLKDIPINSAAQALSGRLAGVQVTTAEGSPDANVQIRVRGGMSITGDNSPLYVVDGIQVENALSVISPQDIESVSVLKDASATAIYGARGANGVVIITTKGGKKGITTVSYSGLVGVRQIAKKLDVWKPYDFVMYQYERSRGGTATEQSFLDTYGAYEDLELYKGVPFVDWQDEVFGRNAVMQTHNFSINGGSEATTFALSLTQNGEEGVMLGSDFDRKLINFKVDHKVSKRVEVGFNVRYNNTIVNGAGTSVTGSSSLNRLRHSVKYRPFVTPGNEVDSYDPEYAQETNANSLSLINPILLTAAEYKQSKRNTTNFSGNVKIKITDYLSFTSTLGVDLYSQKDNVFNDTITSVAKSNGQGQPMASIDMTTRNTLNNSNVLNFSSQNLKSFPQAHSINVLIGQEIYQTNSGENFQDYRMFPVGITPKLAFGSMQLGVANPASFTTEVQTRLLSFFGRASYSYDDKYFLTASMRADGSSKFAPGRRWGYFPAASVMWRVSNENFMQNVSLVTDLKFRASYGASGNNRIPDYLYLSSFEAAKSGFYGINNQQVIPFASTYLANGLLKWEGTVSRNIGIDAGVFNNRIQLSIDIYRNSSKDLLLEKVVPATSGYSTQVQNVGETQNEGIEIQLGATPMHRGDFRWDANFNISFNKNKVVSLGGQNSFLVSSGWAGSNQPADYNVIVGQPVGTIWGLVTDGFYNIDDFDYESGSGTYTLKSGVATNQGITSVAPRPGTIKFKDIDGNGVIDDNDRQVIGRATPKFYGGLNQTFTYRNFDLSLFINFQYGNDVLNANKLEFSSGYTVNSNLLSSMSGRWRNVDDQGQVVTDPTALAALNANATIWSPLTTASSFYVHSWAVEDGSFLRINNLTLGYSLPSSILNKVHMSKFRVYGTVNNLAVFTNYTGYDPEANTRRNTPLTPGVDYAAYPRSRAYIVGVNLTF